MAANRDMSALEQELKELAKKHPGRKRDELFTAWFVRAYLAESFEDGFEALTGASGDKSLDAIYIDDSRATVHVIQAKARQKLLSASEKSADLLAFARVSDILVAGEDAPELQIYRDGLNPRATEKLETARERLGRGYKPHLLFVTSWRVSERNENDARASLAPTFEPGSFEIIDGNQLMTLVLDYQDGVAPPVPSVELPLLDNGTIERASDGVSVWVTAMRGSDIGDLYAREGKRIFARNIRGFLGPETPINKSMVDTIKSDPEVFFYYNNGVTIVCDRVLQTGGKRDTRLVVTNPQIINGQQTTRSLADAGKSAEETAVLVRVIQISRTADGSNRAIYDPLVSSIVKATNWQNPITPADLRSNDPLQVLLEREFRKMGYQYLRKRESKKDAAGRPGSHLPYRLTKEGLAQASSNCLVESFAYKFGPKKGFSDEKYDEIFPTDDPITYLSMWWMMTRVQRTVRGVAVQKEAKWLALHLLWRELGKPACSSDAFIRASESDVSAVMRPLDRVVAAILGELGQYYRGNRKVDGIVLDPAGFFRSHVARKDVEAARTVTTRKLLTDQRTKFENALKSI